MAILLEHLISQLPAEIEQTVQKAKDRFHAQVRDALRRETRLSLRRRGDDYRDAIAIPIGLSPGVPDALRPSEKQTIDDRYRVAILLGPYRRELTALRDSGQVISERLFRRLDSDPSGRELLDERQDSVDVARDYADFLLKKLDEFDLTKFVLRVNEDVLGRYRYLVQLYREHPKPAVTLYWGIIGLVAQDLRVSVEDLTYVVLAHELAHGFTHVGFDADDEYWDSDSFANSEKGLIEGLAQYYTMQVCSRLEDDAPGVLAAFNALLPKQPAEYQTYTRWLRARPEDVRLAMLEIRHSRKPATIKQFETCLDRAVEQLHGQSQEA
jgi:hypothetical protein